KLDTWAWWPDTTLGADLGIADASAGEIYAAMDWLAGRQDSIERKLAAQHLGVQANPSQMALFDTHDLAQIVYPGERLAACRNPHCWPPSVPVNAASCWPPPRNCLKPLPNE